MKTKRRCECGCGQYTNLAKYPKLYANGEVVRKGEPLRFLPSHAASAANVSGHGMSRTPTYRTWAMMLQRCHNKKHRAWKNYGGRGIKVCARWKQFTNFLDDMGKRPAGLTLDRIDNDGNYEPGNCRWVSITEQHANTRYNRTLKYKGKTQHLAAWARDYGICRATLRSRLNNGWPTKEALETPVKPIKR